MAQTKEEYDALEYHMRESWKEKAKPRCFNCKHQQAGDCVVFDAQVPAEFMYQYTECEHHEPDVPF